MSNSVIPCESYAHHGRPRPIQQAGGACRESDGGFLLEGSFQGIEIKGSCRKGATHRTFTFKDIRLQGTHWEHLFLLGRAREPASWLHIRQVEACVWLGYVSRADYITALDADGRPRDGAQDATVTPGSERGWLSAAVRWIPLKRLTLAWWERHVQTGS